jgi:hypothetical protein
MRMDAWELGGLVFAVVLFMMLWLLRDRPSYRVIFLWSLLIAVPALLLMLPGLLALGAIGFLGTWGGFLLGEASEAADQLQGGQKRERVRQRYALKARWLAFKKKDQGK